MDNNEVLTLLSIIEKLADHSVSQLTYIRKAAADRLAEIDNELAPEEPEKPEEAVVEGVSEDNPATYREGVDSEPEKVVVKPPPSNHGMSRRPLVRETDNGA